MSLVFKQLTKPLISDVLKNGEASSLSFSVYVPSPEERELRNMDMFPSQAHLSVSQ